MSVVDLDMASLLAHVPAEMPMAELDERLARHGLTVAPNAEGTVGEWLEGGSPGAPDAWLDPADHLVAGWSGRMKATGVVVSVRPAPRRAVGPNLLGLVLGMRGRFVTLDRVWLRVHRRDAPRPQTEPFSGDLDALSHEEAALYDAIDRELRGAKV